MVEPISITLAALAFLDPMIRAVQKAYGTYKLSKNFGDNYRTVQLRLNGQKACLELAFKTELMVKPDARSLDVINEQLGNIINHFQACQDMVANIEGHLSTPEEPLVNVETHENVTLVDPKSKSARHSKTKWYKPKIWGQKHSQPLPSDVSPSSAAQSDSTIATSENSLATIPSSTQSVSDRGARIAADNQRSASKHLQDVATVAVKARWIRQRKSFIAHLEDIQSSINIITTIVGLRIQADIRKIVTAPVFDGPIPDDILSAQDSLQRLHCALVKRNKSGRIFSNHKSAVISIRVLKATGYVQAKKKVQADHGYLRFRENSAVYPLQVGFANEGLSTMVLAETTFATSTSVAQPCLLDSNTSLSELLCNKDEDGEYSLKAIGPILTPGSATDVHELFQDISTCWTIRDTLEGLMKRTQKYRTFINLAVHIAISYMHFVPIARSHSYPQLSNYLYYSPDACDSKEIGPGHVLTPFLNVGFGSKAPKKSTLEIGGFESQTTDGDEALVRLGLMLHQIGCWNVFDEMDLVTARKTAKSRRNDLLMGAGMPFTQVVELCLASKDEEFDPLELAKRIYGTVVVPLQKLVDELNWD